MRAFAWTTLARIREHSPCESSWRNLLAGLGKTRADDEPLPYARIVEISGLEDALWATRAEPRYNATWRLYAVACARRVSHLSDDPRVHDALDVAERYATGHATDGELRAAAAAARAAGGAAWSAARAAGDAGDAEREWQKRAFLDDVVGGAA